MTTSSPALILDCDGVLADTERDGHLVAFNQAFAEAGLNIEWGVAQYADLVKIGGGKERMRHYLRTHPEAGVSEADLDETVADLHRRKSLLYVRLVEAGRLPGRPGVRRLIESALDDGWRVAVASTSAERSVEAVLRATVGERTRSRLAGVWAGDIVAAKKPAPDIYLRTLTDLDQDPEMVVVVEDSESGARAAAAAGLRHIVTISSLTADDSFPAAATVVSDLGEPDAPAQYRSGLDVRDVDGTVTVPSLQLILDKADRPWPQ
ncbi:HAD superfamily hydrolase (TIGR01509 family) [Branchiibius hedensis]|uniref:Haloacid dehalogenase superfamily, subfamily IA, variant 3 with third motif having DD or ED n=1 Tax=Branchiibius hedensis TaxID=672460 RepID=A0A2Y8ZQV3_9MICO|nr:HAD-IA family hydrolase [Branchiibius hedensis]PWJ25442.1 HAD superfamily hydrolase (TIGR01509 family) [Branchiibius hedensis]SSA34255.1 haloacid dehalogenase superfamily, subfamily IA, variant 3 with third motif having DD or ED [Branchiibius hedensis]